MDYSEPWRTLVAMLDDPPYEEFDYKNNVFKLNQGENKMAGLEDYTITSGPLIGKWDAGALPTVTPTNRQVKIDKVTNGFIVEIGCKKFVAEDWKSLASKLAEYWEDPVKAEKKYCK